MGLRSHPWFRGTRVSAEASESFEVWKTPIGPFATGNLV